MNKILVNRPNVHCVLTVLVFSCFARGRCGGERWNGCADQQCRTFGIFIWPASECQLVLLQKFSLLVTQAYLQMTYLVHFACVVSEICLGLEDLCSIAVPLSKAFSCQNLVSLWLSQKLRRASRPAVLFGGPPSLGCKLCADCQDYSPGLTQLINSTLSSHSLMCKPLKYLFSMRFAKCTGADIFS